MDSMQCSGGAIVIPGAQQRGGYMPGHRVGGEYAPAGRRFFQISNLASVFAVFQISGLAATLQEP